MWTLLQIELYKIFRRPRTYISFVAISAIVLLIQLALFADGESYMEFGMQSLNSGFTITGKKLTGYLICYVILNTLLIHVPLLIALVAGDSFAGESNLGTLRLLASRPISRLELVLGKFTASFIYAMLLLLWMAFLALGLSLLIFGKGDLIVLKSEAVSVVFQQIDLNAGVEGAEPLLVPDMMWRFIAAFLFAAVAMTTVTALAFLLSVFAENAIGPIITTMSIIVVFTILSTMDIPFFRNIQPFLFTTHMAQWKEFFDYPPGMSVGQYSAAIKDAGFWGRVALYPGAIKSVFILLGHVLLFGGTAAIVFRRKNILS